MSAKKGTAQPIIVKKVKKGHGGHHGGAWKVAYADFVTAMMAFFLLMWLLNMSSNEQRVRLAYYFKSFSIFETGGASVTASSKAEQSMSFEGEGNERLNSPSDRDSPGGLNVHDMLTQELGTRIKAQIQAKLGEEMGEQVLVDRVEGGLRIQVVDRDGRSMFELGSAQPRPVAREIVKVIAAGIAGMNNRIMVEGHTDSYGFKGARKNYSNWELSTDRANTTRKLLVEEGISPDRLARVAGYADTEPLVRDVPMDPRNRRISIILLDKPRFSDDDRQKLLNVEPERLDTVIPSLQQQAPGGPGEK